MNVFIILGIVVFAAAFGGVYFLNITAEPGKAMVFTPPYHFAVGEPVSEINSFLFVLIISALFFGIAVPIALGMEGLKYASLLSTGAMPAFDLLFIIPSVFAAYAASLLGQGVIEDYQGKGTVFANWQEALKWFAAGAVLLGILVLVRKYF